MPPRWCDLAENHDDLSAALADPRYIGAPEGIIRRVLAGEFSIDSQGNRRVIDNYFIFHGGHANYPRQSQALWIYSQMIRWGQAEFSPAGVEAALSAYRPDIYRAALGDATHLTMPISASRGRKSRTVSLMASYSIPPTLPAT